MLRGVGEQIRVKNQIALGVGEGGVGMSFRTCLSKLESVGGAKGVGVGINQIKDSPLFLFNSANHNLV